MFASSTGSEVAEWVATSVAHPEMLILLAAGCCALAGFWVRARIAERVAHGHVQPADDLI